MSTQQATAMPPVVSREEWLKARKALLEQEKELTRHLDRVNAQRRRLPMVKIDKRYTFDGPQGKVSLSELFEDCPQLVVYHFMFDPAWERGCSGCTGLVDDMGRLLLLPERGTRFVLISRAPFAKLQAFKEFKGWNLPWYSSFGSDFNYDFHVTLDESVKPVEYNYRTKAQIEAQHAPSGTSGEEHGMSVFFRAGGDVFHTYSAYARGTESITDSYALLDRTPYGRQESFEDSPPGWPQRPTYG